jgi:hypothetical protein
MKTFRQVLQILGVLLLCWVALAFCEAMGLAQHIIVVSGH